MIRTAAVCFVLAGIALGATTDIDASATREIENFNNKFLELHLKMDWDGILAMWADDGVDLMPGENPLIGKPAITKWINDIAPACPDPSSLLRS